MFMLTIFQILPPPRVVAYDVLHHVEHRQLAVCLQALREAQAEAAGGARPPVLRRYFPAPVVFRRREGWCLAALALVALPCRQ